MRASEAKSLTEKAKASKTIEKFFPIIKAAASKGESQIKIKMGDINKFELDELKRLGYDVEDEIRDGGDHMRSDRVIAYLIQW